ncbi:MAG: hypothetical protein RI972_604 [Pseudomonadota bacterium]
MNRTFQTQRLSPVPIGEVPSPCNSICRMDEATAWCQGCARTLPEIAAWAGLDDEGKRQVWAMLPERRRLLGSRFLGPQHEGP